MPSLEQRLSRLEQRARWRPRRLVLTDDDRAQSARELADWRAEQQARIAAWQALVPADRSHVGHVQEDVTKCNTQPPK